MTMRIKPLKKTKINSLSKRFIVWGLASAFYLCLFSCNSSLYDKTIVIQNEQWVEGDSVSFDFEIQDTSKRYNIFLEVNHSIDYAYQNVYCLIQSYAPSGALVQQQVRSLELATKKGKWVGEDLGECNSKACARKIPFIPNTQFPSMGSYKIVLTQYNRKKNLDGINSLRLIINEIPS